MGITRSVRLLFAVAGTAVPLLTLACRPGAVPTPSTPTPTPAPTPSPTPVAAPAPAAPTPVIVVTPTPTPVRPTPTPVGLEIQYGGVLRTHSPDWPPSYDVQVNFSSNHVYYLAKFYNNLLWNPGEDEIVCDVCTEWRVEDGGKTLVFRLRRDVRFHDGKGMTARDVAYSHYKMMGMVDGVISPRSGLLKEYVEKIETPDDYTVVFRLYRPAPAVPQLLIIGFSGIFPEGTTREHLVKGPQGSGPFILKEAIPGSVMRMVRNPNYFKQGKPYLDGIDIFQIRDTNTVLASFFTGRLDFVRLVGGEPSPAQEPRWEAMKQRGQIQDVVYNTGCTPQGINMNAKRPPLNDLRVRQAINLAIDRKAYIEVVHFGRARPGGLFTAGAFTQWREEDFWDKVPGYGTGANKEKEREMARRLLAEAGYPGGVEIPIWFRNTTEYMRQGEFLAGELAKVGIRAKVEVLDASQINERGPRLDYWLWAYYFCRTTTDPDELWGSYFITGGNRNWFGYSNPEVDRLFLEQSQELDVARRILLNRKIEEIIRRDLPIADLAEHQARHGWWSHVRGYRFAATFYAGQSVRQEDVWLARQ
jgi:peptide/nickel transport system substrate-binding protein